MKHLITIIFISIYCTLSAQTVKFNFFDTYIKQELENSDHRQTTVTVGLSYIQVNTDIYRIEDTMYRKSENNYLNTAYKAKLKNETHLIYVFKDTSGQILNVSVMKDSIKTSFYNIDK